MLRKLSAACAASAGLAFAAPQAPDLERAQALVAQGTNAFREAEGLAALKADPALDAAARDFAAYMARTDRYGHEADGATPSQRAERQGYRHCLVAENIAYQYSSAGFRTGELARRFVEGWKDSPGHRRNMLARDALHLAVAIATSAKSGRHYAVQLFARPESAMVEFRVSNATREAARYRIGEREFALAPGMMRIHQTCGVDAVRLAAGRGEAPPMRVAAGDRLRIVREPGGRLVLRTER